MRKQWVKLTVDNVGAHLPLDYPRQLAAGIGDRGVAETAPQVSELLTWIARQGTPDTEYFSNRAEAALILEHAAGIRPRHIACGVPAG
jgi:hypothetical protein